MKNKFFRIKNLIPFTFGLLAMLGLAFVPTYTNNVSADPDITFTNASGDSSINVVAYGKDGELDLTSTNKNVVIENKGTFACQTVAWKDVEYFEIKITDTLPEAEVYNYQYSVIWNPAEIGEESIADFNNDRTEQLTFVSARSSTFVNNVKFYISDTAVLEENSYRATSDLKESQDQTGKWGIYQFIFTCNGTTHHSYVFEVTPENPDNIDDLLPVSVKESATRSKYSINSAYVCTLQVNDYYYVNHERLVWKVSGTSSGGEKYVLLPKDIPNDEKGKIKSLIADNSFNRTGPTFTFDFEIGGDWEITCSVVDESGNEIKTSNAIVITTVRVVESYVYILVIAGAVVIAVVVLTIIIVRAKKKEKVW